MIALLEVEERAGASNHGPRCGVEGCDRKHAAKGYCRPHYKRWKRWGDPGGVDLGRHMDDPLARFESKVKKSATCWLWSGATLPTGYGVFGLGRRTDGVQLAHRFAYQQYVGPIPEGLHIDHLCSTPSCVRPDHLEPVTQAENNRRQRDRQGAKS